MREIRAHARTFAPEAMYAVIRSRRIVLRAISPSPGTPRSPRSGGWKGWGEGMGCETGGSLEFKQAALRAGPLVREAVVCPAYSSFRSRGKSPHRRAG